MNYFSSVTYSRSILKQSKFHVTNYKSRYMSLSPRRPFSDFIVTSSLIVKKRCLLKSQSESKQFKLVHLRATDRPCAMGSYSPESLLRKLEKFGVNISSDVIYLMTDLERTDALFLTMQEAFGSRLCSAQDISLFKLEPFTSDVYLIYATELALQDVCEGFVETYPGHSIGRKNKLLGTLSPPEC